MPARTPRARAQRDSATSPRAPRCSRGAAIAPTERLLSVNAVSMPLLAKHGVPHVGEPHHRTAHRETRGQITHRCRTVILLLSALDAGLFLVVAVPLRRRDV